MAYGLTAVSIVEIKPKGFTMPKHKKIELYCPNCSVKLALNSRGQTYCPKCGQTIDPKDADHVDPKLAKKAGLA